MADQDLQRGLRAIYSGGAHELDDEQLSKLIEAVAEAQKSRGKSPSIEEVTYLEEIVKICEDRLNLTDSQFRSNERLNELNERYPNINEQIKRSEIAGPDNLVDQDAGWYNSDCGFY